MWPYFFTFVLSRTRQNIGYINWIIKVRLHSTAQEKATYIGWKQRRYREKLKNNPEKLEEVRKKNLARIKARYAKSAERKISEMTPAEQMKKRAQWRKDKRKQMEKKKKVSKQRQNFKFHPGTEPI